MVGLYLLLGLAYSTVNPILESPDELLNYENVRFLAEEQRLSVLQPDEFSKAHHPPLYYVVGALLTGWTGDGGLDEVVARSNPYWGYRTYQPGVDNKSQYLHDPALESWPYEGAVLGIHLMRWLSLLMGAGVIVTVYKIGRELFPQEPWLAWGAASLVAFNPMFLFIQSSVHNDALTNLLAALTVWGVVRYWRRGPWPRRAAFLGIVSGLGILTKITFLFLGPMVGLAMVVRSWRDRHTKPHWQRQLVQMLIIGGGLVALIAGWWFVRNQFLYGEPTGFRTVTELWGARDPLQSLPLALSELPHAWSTLWGRFGYGQIPLPDVVYDGLAWIVFAGLLGFVVALIRRRHKTPASVLLLLALDVVLIAAVLFNYMLVSPAGAMGRFFFPGLPALGLLTFYGLSHVGDGALQLARRLHRGRETGAADDGQPSGAPGLALLANAGMLALALAALFAYLAPAYARPPTLAAGALIPNEVNANFSGLATLRGYRLSAGPLRPGQPLDVQLYWEVTGRPPGNFLLFLHLIDETGTIVAQRDTHPGTGNFPTSQWRPGDRFVDSLRVYVPETAYTPAEVTVSVGLYAPTYRLAIAGPQGTPWGDALTLGSLQLLPARELAPDDRDLPNPLDKNFQNEIRLRGYSYGQRILAPGEELPVTLYWQRLRDPRLDYVLRLELLDEAGRLRAGIDSPLPLEAWTSPGIAAETYRLTLPEDLAPDSYRVRLILLDPESGQAHHIVAPDGHYVAEHLDLARIRLRATEAN
jgi:4-amino-4-deoxy-L-arabinose transferase-like glycosyltransferase